MQKESKWLILFQSSVAEPAIWQGLADATPKIFYSS
jgi:hypothetical protein